MDSYAKSCALVRTEKNYSIQLRMRHGHIFDFPEFFPFVDQYLKGGVPMPVVSSPELKAGQLIAQVKASTKLISARLHYTTGSHTENKARPWTTKNLAVDGHSIKGDSPPKEATAWYVDLTDERKVLVSSQVMVR
jgi:hypothetical protein